VTALALLLLLLSGDTPSTHPVTVTVFYDENGNGSRDPSERVTIPGVVVEGGGSRGETKASGAVALPDVPEGLQEFRVVEETLPPFFVPGPAVRRDVGGPLEVELGVTLPIGSNRPNTYLAFGDSITAGEGSTGSRGFGALLQAKLREHFGGATVIADGVSGLSTERGLRRLRDSLARQRPAYTLVLLGTNDWDDAQDQGALATATVEHLRSMVRRVRAAGSLAFVASLPPPNVGYDWRVPPERDAFVQKVNGMIEAMAREENAVFVPLYRAFREEPDWKRLFRDHLHPNDRGYALIAETLYRSIVARVPPPPGP
jgi:acyl-CoA thioesterase-1